MFLQGIPSELFEIAASFKDTDFRVDSTDGAMFSRVALDIRKAVEIGDLPGHTIVNRGRYRYSPTVEHWVMRHLPVSSHN